MVFLHISLSLALLIITLLGLPILLWDKPLNTSWSTAHEAPKVSHTGFDKDTVILRLLVVIESEMIVRKHLSLRGWTPCQILSGPPVIRSAGLRTSFETNLRVHEHERQIRSIDLQPPIARCNDYTARQKNLLLVPSRVPYSIPLCSGLSQSLSPWSALGSHLQSYWPS